MDRQSTLEKAQLLYCAGRYEKLGPLLLPLLLLQILMVHSVYRRKIRYGYSC